MQLPYPQGSVRIDYPKLGPLGGPVATKKAHNTRGPNARNKPLGHSLSKRMRGLPLRLSKCAGRCFQVWALVLGLCKVVCRQRRGGGGGEACLIPWLTHACIAPQWALPTPVHCTSPAHHPTGGGGGLPAPLAHSFKKEERGCFAKKKSRVGASGCTHWVGFVETNCWHCLSQATEEMHCQWSEGGIIVPLHASCQQKRRTRL